MKTRKQRTKLPVLCAGLIASAATAFAGEQTLPTPPPSGYVDTESSVNVPIADWPRLRRRFTLALAANTSPTGCVQVAFGRDTNGDECLEPEETELVVGNDCGAVRRPAVLPHLRPRPVKGAGTQMEHGEGHDARARRLQRNATGRMAGALRPLPQVRPSTQPKTQESENPK